MRKYLYLLILTIILLHPALQAQTKSGYNLANLLNRNQFLLTKSRKAGVLQNSLSGAIYTTDIIWFNNIYFEHGTIDIDLRGKNVFLRSFLGITFHGLDTTHYNVLYFRPFNFRHPDTLRRKWSVAYMSVPDYGYTVLRKAYPLEYENSVQPVPLADDWFHATVVIKDKMLSVYVNHSPIPSLQCRLIGDQNGKMLGLFSDGLDSDFANLNISEK